MLEVTYCSVLKCSRMKNALLKIFLFIQNLGMQSEGYMHYSMVDYYRYHISFLDPFIITVSPTANSHFSKIIMINFVQYVTEQMYFELTANGSRRLYFLEYPVLKTP